MVYRGECAVTNYNTHFDELKKEKKKKRSTSGHLGLTRKSCCKKYNEVTYSVKTDPFGDFAAHPPDNFVKDVRKICF